MALAVVHAITAWPELARIALAEDCPFFARVVYPLFHASFLHAALNAWCLLSVIFIYDVSFFHLITACLIASSFPVSLVSCGPTVGASGICFALLGIISPQVQRKLYYHTWVVSIILSGFIIPFVCNLFSLSVAQPNNWLHIWCYLIGLIAGYLIHSHNSHSPHQPH